MPDPEPARGGDKPGISNGAGGSSNSAVAPVRAKAAKAKLVRRKPRKKVVIALDNIRPAKGPDDLVWLPSGSKASPPQKQPVEKDQEAAETKEGPSESSKMAAPLKETSTAATAAAANETKSTQKDLASISRRGSSASVPPSPMATAISNGAYSSTSGNSGKEYARRSNGRLNNNETDGSFLKGATQEKQLNKGDHQNLASNPSNLAAEEEEDNFTTSSNSIHPSQFEDAEEDETKNAIVSSTPAQPTSSVASSGRKYDMEMSQFANAPVEILSDEIMGATKSNKGTSTDLEKNSSSGNNSSTGVSGNSTGPALSTCVSNVATTKTVQNNSYNTAHRDIQNKLSSTDRSSTGSGSEEKQKQAPAHSLRRNASSIEPNRESQTQVSSKLIHDKKAPSGLEHQSNGSQYSGSKDSNDDYDSSSDDENLADLTSKEHALFRNIQKDIDRQEEQECFQQLEDDIDQQEEREKLQKLEGETNRKSKGVAGDSENLRDKGRQQQTPANGKLERSQRKDNSSSDILDVSSNRPKERRSKHDAGVASSTNSKRAPTTTSIIRASKLVPRLEPYLSIETFPIQVLEPFYEHLSSRGFTEDSMVHFSASLANPMDGDQTSLVLTVEGQRAVVDEFRDFFFFNWLNVLWARKCHQQLLQDKRTVQLDVLLNKDSLLKVWAEELLVEVSLQGRSQGLWVDLTTCSPALENLLKDLLGESAFQSDTLTVAILSINNSQCETSEEWNQLGNHLQEISDEQVTAKLCVCGYVDLDSMPRDGAPLPCFVTVDKKNDIVSDIDASLASRSQSPPSDKEMPKGKTSGASAAKASHQFKAKYTEVYKIEYSLSDIGFQFVMSQMWIQHKIEYSSEACGNECPCAFGLDKMTKLVIQRWVSLRMRKGDENFIIPHWAQDVDDSPVGFVNRFAPKFIPLLKSEYPRESASQILDRLVKMWNLGHLYQKNFGNRCGAKCMCLQGWKSVFRFGAMDAVAEARKRKTLLGTHHLEDTLVVPRKRSRIENANRLEAQAERNPLVSVPRKTPSSKPSSVSSLLARMGESASIERKAPVSAQEKHVDSDALQKEGIVDNKLEAYSVTFDTSLPLGFYCVTENIDGQKVCKIDSVAPLGESRKKNILVQEGTCVEAVELQLDGIPKRYPIKGHEELMLYYEHAKSAQNRLKIWFVNTFVTSASENTSNSTAGSGSINDEWSSKGKWCGHLTSGWAGGALQTITSTTISSPPSAINDSSNHLGKASSDFSEVRNDASMVPKTLEQVEGMRYPAHRSKQPISSLIKATSLITNNRRPSKGPRRVQFANTGTMTVRYYNVLSPSCHLLTGADDSSVGNFENGNANNSAVLASESLSEVVKAARCNDHERLVVCLREVSVSLGQTGTDKDWLTRECHNAKYKCHEQVHRVLSVYKAAEAAISYAQAMKSWYAYHVQVEKIVGLRFPHEASSDHRLRSFSGKVYFFVNRNSKNYPSLPPMEISDVVDYGGGKTCALPEISPLHFNSALEDARVLLIHLHSVEKKSNAFATIRVPMSEIHATCTTVGKAVAIEKEFSCKMGSKQGAKIFLKTTKRHVLPDYLNKKIQIGSEELVNAIDGIEKFNDSNIVKIRAHIFGKQGFSLLHAAIVYERPDLVTRLLALGADPNARSDVGSAAAFAMYRAERERFAKTKLDIEALSVECNDKLSCLDAMAEELKMHAKFQQQLESISDHDSVASPNPLTSSVSTAQHKSLQKVPGNNSQAQARVLKRKANELDNSCETGSKGQALPRGMQAFLESISEKAEQWIEMTQVVSAFYAKYGEMDKDHFEATHWRALEDGLVEWGRRGLQSQIIPVSYREENTYDLSSQRFLRLTSRGQAIVAEGYSTSDLDHHVRQPTVDVLPSVTDNWFVVKGQRGKPCKFFRNAMECQCMHGARCLHPHIQPRLGNQFNRENMRIPSLILSEPNIAFCRQPDAASGKDWFTAVYRDPVSNIYFRAEGGLTGRKNAQGIWWYPTDVEAKKAVEFVYAARNVCSGVNKMSK